MMELFELLDDIEKEDEAGVEELRRKYGDKIMNDQGAINIRGGSCLWGKIPHKAPADTSDLADDLRDRKMERNQEHV